MVIRTFSKNALESRCGDASKTWPIQAPLHILLFIDVLRTSTLAAKFKLHDVVVMPDHFHVLLMGIRALNARSNSSKVGIHFGVTKSSGWQERSGRPDFPKSVSWTGRAFWRIRNISMRIR
jgi:REP element-mobilizing transposase RayT